MLDFSLLASDGGFLSGFISGALLIMGLGLCVMVLVVIKYHNE